MIGLGVSGFEWDSGNRGKCGKHGVPLAAIESAFQGPVAVLPDPMHSGSEERFKAIGQTGGRFILIVFTLRAKNEKTFIRPISARFMHRKEIDYYDQGVAEADKR